MTPLSLVIFDHQFYVVARRETGALYAFRFARMADVEATEEKFEYPSALEYDPANVFRAHFGINLSSTGPLEDVEILLDEPWAHFAMSHKWHPSQQVERFEDGRVRVTITAHVCREIETWVLSLGECATVIKPDTLRAKVAERLTKAVVKYEEPRPILARGGTAKGGIAKTRPTEQGTKAKLDVPGSSSG